MEIISPHIPGTADVTFRLEISEAYDRTTEKIADEEMTFYSGMDVGRWVVTLGGEQAQVLDGMPGQDLQRRVIIVHRPTLYILAFMPTRSNNQEVDAQMDTLYEAITSSWVWMSSGMPCPVP